MGQSNERGFAQGEERDLHFIPSASSNQTPINVDPDSDARTARPVVGQNGEAFPFSPAPASPECTAFISSWADRYKLF